jgi:hypothetical protein
MMEVRTGDVIEAELHGETVTVLVLLATPEAVILDPCDGSTPYVMHPAFLRAVRVFDPKAA